MSISIASRRKRLTARSAGAAILSLLFLLAFMSVRTYAQQVVGGEGTYASSAISQNGTLYVWGYDNYNHTVSSSKVAQDSTPVVVAFPTGVTAWTSVAEGLGFTLAIGNDGNLYTWGYNNYGQLGNGSTTNSPTPVLISVSGVTSWKAVAAGDAMSFAIGNNDSLYSWGYNNFGQLGNGGTTNQSAPATVHLPAGVLATAVSAAGNSALAIGTDGKLYAWGRNVNGQLGQGNTTDQKLPVIFPLPAGVVPVKPISGAFFNAVVASDGNIYGSGSNGNGQLGDGTTTQRTSPVVAQKPIGVTSWRSAACGASFVLAIGSNDSLYAWGYNGTGELGWATGNSNNTAAVKDTLPNGALPAAVAAGHNHGFVIGNDGRVYAWGLNGQGQLGTNSTTGSGTSSAVTIFGADSVGAAGNLTVGTIPSVPVLANPANKATGQPISLTLKWNKVSAATSYRIQVSSDPTFASGMIADSSSVTDTTFAVAGLFNATSYYWRVRSYTGTLYSAYAKVDTFTTIQAAPPAPTLVGPASNALNTPNRDTLICNSIVGVSKYNWQVSTDIGFSTFAVNDSTTDTTNIVSGLLPATKYYWRVRAINPGGAGNFGGPDSFTVMAAPPTTSQVAPADGSTFVRADTLMLVWNSVAGATGYSYQISDTISFARVTVSDDSVSGSADTTSIVTRLSNLTKYYWRVRTYNAGGYSAFSTPDSFTTIISVPVKPALVAPAMQSTSVPRKATFTWSSAVRAVRYELQIATNYAVYQSGDSVGAFLKANVVFDTTVTDTTVHLSNPLAASTKYYWHVGAIDTAGANYSDPYILTTGTGIDAVVGLDGIPKEFNLLQNYPNPFNPSTIIRYDVPKTSDVTIRVYDILGREVATLVDARQAPGRYAVEFNASRFASGVYFFRMSAGTYSKIQKMMLIK